MATGSRSGGAAWVAVIAVLFACSDGESKNKSAGAPGGTAAGEPAIPAALFSHIPADTPYVLATFESMPRSYMKRVDAVIEALMGLLPEAADLNPTSSDPAERFLLAAWRDLRTTYGQNRSELEKLLASAGRSRFALFGGGIIPVVRVELPNSKALAAWVERIERTSGVALPTADLRGRSYWRLAKDDVLAVAAIADGHLVLSAGPLAMVENALPFILGLEKPKPNMADGGQLKIVAARHGFAGYGAGYVDTGNLFKLLVVANFFRSAGAVSTVPPACMDELSVLTRRFPRVAFGYEELSGEKMSFRLVFETDAAIQSRLRQLVVEVPGLVTDLAADRPLFAVGVGVDLDKGKALALDAAAGIERVAGACGAPDVAKEMADVRADLARPLPPGLAALRGALVSVLSAELGADGKPRGAEAYGVVAADPLAALHAFVVQSWPGPFPDIAADGKFHELMPEGAVPGLGAVRVAMKPHGFVAVTGAKGAEAAERAMARRGPSPLIFMSYDVRRISALVASADQRDADKEKLILKLFGSTSWWLAPSEHGLTFTSVELN